MGDIPWGTHLCQFYETRKDLLDSLVPFFKAGLEHGEYCLWVVSDPLTGKDARTAMRRAVRGFDRHLSAHRIEILHHEEWYLKGSSFDLKRTMRRWHERLDQALARGHAGMRVSGNIGWLRSKDWEMFSAYERAFDASMARRPMIALCTYPLATSAADLILNVVRTHKTAVAVRSGRWEVLETSQLTRAKEEIERLKNDQASTSREQLQRLSRRLLHLQETERRAIARELHDEIGQLLTALRLMLTIKPGLPPGKALSRMADAQSIVQNLFDRVRTLALDLRPAMLDELGLVRSLLGLFRRYTKRTNIAIKFDHAGLESKRFAPEVETAAYRIVQEALTNVARHAGVTRATVRLRAEFGMLSVAVEDSGRGFSPWVGRLDTSTGLTGMRERAMLLGGTLTVDSAPGDGTRIIAGLPAGGGPPSGRGTPRPRRHAGGRPARRPGRESGLRA